MDQASTTALTCAVIALIVLIFGTIVTFRKYWIELGIQRSYDLKNQAAVLNNPAAEEQPPRSSAANRHESLSFDNAAVDNGDAVVRVHEMQDVKKSTAL